MTTHSQKKLDETDLIEFRNRFNLPLTDEQATGLEFYKPAEDSAEMRTCISTAQAGRLPAQKARPSLRQVLPVPAIESYAQFACRRMARR
jgi:pyruvate dehydrogenase E1 component